MARGETKHDMEADNNPFPCLVNLYNVTLQTKL